MSVAAAENLVETYVGAVPFTGVDMAGYGKLSPKVIKRAVTKGEGVKAKAVVAMGKALKGMRAK